MDQQLLPSAIFSLAESTINRLLQLDPASQEALRRIEGKLIHIHCTSPDISLFIQPNAYGISLFSQSDFEADTEISGSAAALISLLTASNRAQAMSSEDITISGDIELSQELQRLLDQLEIDWEAQLAVWFGDVAAHQMGNQLRSLFDWGVKASTSMMMNIEEYLHEESRAMPPRAELEQFYRGIERITLDTDRLAARINRLAERHVSQADNQELN